MYSYLAYTQHSVVLRRPLYCHITHVVSVDEELLKWLAEKYFVLPFYHPVCVCALFIFIKLL